MALLPVGFTSAVTLLTRVPLRRRDAFDPHAAGAWFAVVGGLTGLMVGLVLLAGGGLLPALVAALLAVAAEVVLTGALHLDGLADCADGTAGKDRGRRLAIMRDHTVGVYGATAIVCSIGLRTSCLAALLDSGIPAGAALGVLVGAWTLSRGATLGPAYLLGSARHDGLGREVIESMSGLRAALGVSGALVLAFAAGALGAGGRGVTVALGMSVGAAAATVAVTLWAHRRIGGATGDVLGLAAEAALALSLVVAVALAW